MIGVKPDGTREVCAAGVSDAVAESAASTLRTMKERGYTEVLVIKESGEDSTFAKSWRLKLNEKP